MDIDLNFYVIESFPYFLISGCFSTSKVSFDFFSILGVCLDWLADGVSEYPAAILRNEL